MKKIAIVAILIALFAGCEKPSPAPEELSDVTLSLTYTLDTSVGADMTKATDADIFDMFYQKMKTGELTAQSYSLTFTETTTGEVYVFNGRWGSNSMITIQTGKYHITGTSKADGQYIQEKASLIFDEEMEISSSSSSVVLKAAYDCFLLAFAKSDIKSMENYYFSGGRNQFYVLNNYFYVFVNDTMYHKSYKSEGYIKGTRTDDSTFMIYTGKANFEKGKYYIYNDVGGSFELPEMDTAYELPSMEPGI